MTARHRFRSFYNAVSDIELKDDGGVPFGRSIIEYQMYRRTDVSNLKHVRGHFLHVTQRIIIPNQTEYSPGAKTSVSYENYPAIIHNRMKIDLNNKATARLSSVFPRTLNSNVTANSSSSSTGSSSVMHQTTSGSSSTNVNTFGVTVSLGFFGEIPIGDLALSYSHSWIHGSSHEAMAGDSATASSSDGKSTTMSVKDWSAYSQLGEDDLSVAWIWGQSYPWDVILYSHSQSGDNIELPDFIRQRMINGDILLPPSELSLFGVDFTAHAGWIIEYPEGVTEDETVTVSHETTCYTASHSLNDKKLSADLQSAAEASLAKYSSPSLALSLYSLAPVGGYGVEDPATIGFRVDAFSYPPTKPADKFKIVSKTNDLQVTGSGFDDIMTSSFKTDPTLELQFKIADTHLDYSLILFHWLEGDCDCLVNWTVNEKFSGSSRINRVVNSEGQASDTVIPIRNRDFGSLNFHDYLVIGLNSVKLRISRIDEGADSAAAVYTLSSVTIR